MRGESGVAGEGRVVGAPKFHSSRKCTIQRLDVGYCQRQWALMNNDVFIFLC